MWESEIDRVKEALTEVAGKDLGRIGWEVGQSKYE